MEYLLFIQNIEELVIWLWILNEDLGSHSFLLRREEVKVMKILSSLFTKKLDILFYLCKDIRNENI